MARSIEALAPLARPVSFLPESWRVPLLGWLWVLFNIFVVWLGMRIGHPALCAMAAGGVDGTVIAVIAVAKASAKFQAVTTGLLGGLGLNRIGSEANLLTRSADAIHCFVDSFMDGFNGSSCAAGVDNPLHAQIEAAVLRIVWTAIFVILASLVAEWVRASMSAEESR